MGDVRYVASAGGVNIAYRVVGNGPIDVVVLPGIVSHVELQWSDPGWAHFGRRMLSFSRLITYDKPGTGLSDPPVDPPVIERRVQDVIAVMDAVGSEQAVMLGVSEGGPLGVYMAAAHPERVRSVILLSSILKGEPDEQFPWGVPTEAFEALLATVDTWGEGRSIDLLAPTLAGSRLARRTFARFERCAGSPGSVRYYAEMIRRLDVTHLLPEVRVPTLVVNRTSELVPVEAARYAAKVIPDAQLIELEGTDHIPWVGDTDPTIDAIERFITGRTGSVDADRAVVSILFVDVVDSTGWVTQLGDRRWRQLLHQLHDGSMAAIEDAGGRRVSTAGDGLLAVFDGPVAAVNAAWQIRDTAAALEIEVRAGVHTGEVELDPDDVHGVAVHVAARVLGAAQPSQVLVTAATAGLLASAAELEPAGDHTLRGVPGTWALARAEPPGTEFAPLVMPAPRRVDRMLTWLARRAADANVRPGRAISGATTS